MANVIEVILNLVDNLSDDIKGATSTVEGLEDAVSSASNALDNVDASSLTNAGDLAESARDNIESVAGAADTAKEAIDGIDGSKLDDTAKSADGASEGLEKAGESAGVLEGAVSAVVAIGIVEWLEGAAEAAGTFSDNFLIASTNLGTAPGNIEAFKAQYGDAINTVMTDTGRGTTYVVDQFNQLGIAGVQSADMLIESSDAISGANFSLERNITSSYQRIIMGATFRSETLKRLGITDQDVLNSTGMTVDQLKAKWPQLTAEQRAHYLNSILNSKYGVSSNEAYKQSWEHVKDALGRAGDAISRIVGSFILPILIPALEKATGFLTTLADKLKSLPAPVQTLVGAVVLLVGGFVALVGILAAATTAWTALNITQTLAGIRTGITTALTWAQIIANNALIISQMALNLVMSMNPIAIVVIAVVALIAALYYLYNTNETVRNAINGLWEGLKALGDYIYGGLVSAWNYLTTTLQPVVDALGNLWSAITEVWNAFASDQAGNATGIFTQIWDALSGVADIIWTYLYPVLQQLWSFMSGVFSAAWTTLSGVISAVVGHIARVINIFAELLIGNITLSQALGLIWDSIKTMLFQVFIAIMAGVGQFAINLINKAVQAGQGFVNGIINWIKSLPGKVWSWLVATAQRMVQFASDCYNRAHDAGQRIINGIREKLVSLPGQMYNWGKNAITSFINAIIDSIPGLRGALDYVKSFFPSSPPKQGPLADIKPENIYGWGQSLGTALSDGVGSGAGGLFENIKSAIPTTVKTPSVEDTGALVVQSDAIVKTAENTKAGVTTAYEQMGTGVTNSLTELVNDDKTSWDKIRDNTKTQLNNIRKTTGDVTNQMLDSWKYMASGITNSADRIRRDSSSDISTLSGNIRTFYTRIRHPESFFAGPGGSRISSGYYAGVPSSSADLLNAFMINDAPCTSCFAGGWDVATPNTSAVKSTIRGYNVMVPGMGDVLKVRDFADGKNPLYGNMKMFELLASKLIDGTAYDFYYNGRYSNAEALARGAFNCWDGAEILVALANAMGLPAEMIHGRWGNVGHMAAKVGGVVFDTTQRQNRGVWRGTPGVSFGPGGGMGDGGTEVNINVDLTGTPPGNSDRDIADMIIEGVKDRKVMDVLKAELGRGVNRTRRKNGV